MLSTGLLSEGSGEMPLNSSKQLSTREKDKIKKPEDDQRYRLENVARRYKCQCRATMVVAIALALAFVTSLIVMLVVHINYSRWTGLD
jgi:hypothetical protein